MKLADSGSGSELTPLNLEVIADLQDLLLDPGAGRTLRDLYDTYTEAVANSLSGMRSAHTNGDNRALADQAHRLRGSSATLGAQRLAKVYARIEEQSRAGHVEGVDDLLADIEREVAAYRVAVAPMLEPHVTDPRRDGWITAAASIDGGRGMTAEATRMDASAVLARAHSLTSLAD